MPEPPGTAPDSNPRPGDDSFAGHLPVADALGRMLSAIEPISGTERVGLRDALGRVLATAVESPIDVPPADNSAMDGYAVRAADLADGRPTRLAIAGTAFAGRPFRGACPAGSAVRIMTGATMPAGLDTVVAQEFATADAATVTIPPDQVRGQNRRLRGEDLGAGMPAIPAGRRLAPADVGLLASIGLDQVVVRRRVRVAFFSTGDELRPPGEALGDGQIYDSNRATIDAMLRRLGVEPIDMGTVADRADALERTMRGAAAQADAIVSSGGVSVGEADHTRTVMARLGDVAFWTIAMRPGRPMAFGRTADAWYFGLPGNPVAVMVAFYILARPALLALGGATPTAPIYARARAAAPIRKRPGRTEYQRGYVDAAADGTMRVAPAVNQGSGVLSSMSRANCLVVLHHDQGPVASGDWVDCLPFDGLC